MIVYDFNIFCASLRPTKAYTPLIVDTNAILTCSVAFECFKAISGRYLQVIQSAGNFKLPQLPPSYRSNIHESSDMVAF